VVCLKKHILYCLLQKEIGTSCTVDSVYLAQQKWYNLHNKKGTICTIKKEQSAQQIHAFKYF